jgi:2-polyprenyl-6-methoxyphenol hydroxylase-like FAD-dependent oxidoreductase
MKNKTVLISGAGVAGLALAHWLTRYGFTATVIERAPALRAGGHAVDIRGAARDVAERMGVLAEIKQARVNWRGMSYVDQRGHRRAALPAELFGMRDGELAQIEIQRGDLVRIFHAASQEGVEYLFDDSITALTQNDEGVEVTFANSSPRTFDLVVGADGERSRVRALAFGDDSKFTHEYPSYTAFFTVPQRFDLDGWELFCNLPGRKVAAIRPGRQGVNTKVLLSFASSERHDTRDVEEQKRIVADEFEGAGWEVPQLLQGMKSANDFSFGSSIKITMDCWSRGRAVLLGDSAWASFAGHGTSFAVIGAYLLAGELATGDDHRIALARYEKQLRQYVELGQQGPPGGEKMFLPNTKMGIWLRNQSIRMLPHMPWKGLVAKGADKATAVPLDDYVPARRRADRSVASTTNPAATAPATPQPRP